MKIRNKKLYTESDLDKVKQQCNESFKLGFEQVINAKLNQEKICENDKYILKSMKKVLGNSSELDYLALINNVISIGNNSNNAQPDNDEVIKERFITEYSYYCDIINNLLESIRSNVEITASPLSKKINELKTDNSELINTFLNWKNEIDDEDSSINYSTVVSTFRNQSKDFEDFDELITKDFQYITSSLVRVEHMFSKISSITKNIEDIATNIKTLSINASIEAARAGEHGKGFKVIALGTKDLSDQTNKLLESIVTTVKETKGIIRETSDTINRQRDYLNIHSIDQQKGYKSFYSVLVNFYSRFEEAFEQITKGTEKANEHINGISPMIQLHDAIIQEIDNISKIIVQFNSSYDHIVKASHRKMNTSELQMLLNKIVSIIEDQITTDGEVKVLGRFSKKHNLIRDNKIETVNKDIEFF